MHGFTPLLIATLLIPICAPAQDTLSLRPMAILPGSEILQVGGHRAVVRFVEIGVGRITRYLDVYDLSDSTAPRLIDHCLPMRLERDFESTYFQIQGDAVQEDSILYVTMNTEFTQGSNNPCQNIGPLTVKAHIIGTDHDLWDITILDSLYEEANPDSGDWDLVQYFLPRSVIQSGDYLIVAAGSWGVRIYDISDRMAPRQVAQIDSLTKIVSLWSNKLLLVRSDRLFDLFDFSVPTNPELIGTINLAVEHEGDVNSMRTSIYGYMPPVSYSFYMDYLYISTMSSVEEADPQLVVFDIASDEAPVEVARLDVPFNNNGYSKYFHFTIGNNRLYTLHDQLLDIYDLRDPLAPELAGTVRILASEHYQMIAQDDQLYLSYGGDAWWSDSSQVTIYNVGPNVVLPSPLTPYTLHLFPPFPNPFNSSTTISYSLPHPGRYALDIVDIRGRLVTRLSDGWKEAGSYREVWEGAGVGSGVYYLKVEMGASSDVKPVVLIR